MGSGQLEGTELVENQVFLGHPCFSTSQAIYGLRGVGTYAGKTTAGDPVVYRAELGSGLAIHQGPLTLEVENTGPFYHGPSGTHGSDSTCAQGTAGSPVAAVFRLFAANHVYRLDGGNQVPCVGHGSFVRSGADWHADWTLDAECVVVGNEAGTPGTGVAPAGTAHTHKGKHDPCGGGCNDNFHDLAYKQHFPVPGLAVDVTGPATRAINRTATLTAVVRYDGLLLKDAAVTFSVAGPASSTPPSAAATTGADGQAKFSFSAPVEGSYVVTVSAVSPLHPGQNASTTYPVFFSGPRPALTLSSLPGVQNGDPAPVIATVVDESDPVENSTAKDPVGDVTVSFSVAAPAGGVATPASGSAVTSSDKGRATFTFTGNRAGAYVVTATASHAGVDMTATHTVPFEVKTMSLAGAIDLPPEESVPGAMVVDPAGTYAYAAAALSSVGARVVKVDLATFQRVGVITANLGASGAFGSAVIDPAGNFAYFGTGSFPNAGRIVKVDLNTFEQVGMITLAADERQMFTAVIDPAGKFAYFAARGGRIIKIDLATFQRVGDLIPPGSSNGFESAVIDPAGNYAYFAGVNNPSNLPARVVKIDLATFQDVGVLTLDDGEWNAKTAMIDPAGDFAYFGVVGASFFAELVKVDLRTFRRVGTLPLTAPGFGASEGNINPLGAGAMDPGGRFAYVGGTIDTSRYAVKVDLATFQVLHVIPLGVTYSSSGAFPAAIEPDGENLYFAARSADSVGKVIKVGLTRPPKAQLVAGDDAYPTAYSTPLTVAAPGVLANDADTEDGDPLVAGQASDPPGGSVSLNPDGSFTYTPDAGFSGPDTFTYTASDGMDHSTRATVSVTVGPPEGLTGGAFGYLTDVSLFGGPSERQGSGQPATAPATAASPAVSLPAEGSSTPISAHDADGAAARYGPAVIFGGIWPDDVAAGPPSGPITAVTSGTTAAGGSVTSSSKIELYPTPVPVRCYGAPLGTANCTAPGGIGPGPLIADEVESTCSANRVGASASARFVNGVVETKYDPDTQMPVESVPIPDEPPAGYTVKGTLDHVGDSFRIVFNEQVRASDGSLVIVNAAHVYLLGPTAVGDMVIGQSVCGVPPAGPNTPPDAVDDAYSTPAGTPHSVSAPGVLANDTDVEGDPLTAGSASTPANGSVALNADGSFTYTPTNGFTGVDSFTYVASDGNGGSATATVTITVTAPPVTGPTTLSVNDLWFYEGDSEATAATFTITRSGANSGSSTVKYKTSGGTATAGAEYAAVPLTPVTFAPGETNKTVTVNVVGDVLPEKDETFNLVLSAPTGAVIADASGTATVVNDDGSAYLAVGSLSVLEGSSATTPASFTITRTGNTNGASTVRYKTSGGTAAAGSDHTAVSLTTVSFAPAETSKTVAVDVIGDTTDEPNETFNLVLSAASAGTVLSDPSGMATIVDDDGPVAPGPATFLSVNDLSVTEGTSGMSAATFTIIRSGDTGGASTVKYRTSGGTATAGVDYTAVPLAQASFAAGETSKTVTVDVAGDTSPEANETFNLVLSAPTGATIADASGAATILNDDGAAYLTVSNVTVTEEDSGTTPASFTITRMGNITGSSTVKYKTSGGTASAGSDYTTVTLTTLTFNPGETTKTVTVDVNGDTAVESNEAFNLVLSAATGATISDAAGAATIVNDD